MERTRRQLKAQASANQRLVLEQYADQLATVNSKGFSSPFKEMRQDKHPGTTITELSRIIGISKQALIRNEQCTYTEPLPVALIYWAAQGYDKWWIREEYTEFQAAMRKENIRMFGDLLPLLPYYSKTLTEVPAHPFSNILGDGSTTSLSKTLCLPQATLDYFLRNPIVQKSIPKCLIDVLQEIGYTNKELEVFNTRYDQYREYLIYKNRVQQVANGSE